MTSAAQLPVDVALTKASPNGETARARLSRSDDEYAEGGFAAVLAQAWPEPAQGAKATPAVAPTSMEVEGEDISAKTLDVADAGEAERLEGAVRAAAGAQLQQLTAETAAANGPQSAPTQTDGPGAAGEGAVVETPNGRSVETEEAVRQSPENDARAEELTLSETRSRYEKRAAELAQPGHYASRSVELRSAAAQSAGPQPERAPQAKSAAPERQGSPAPLVEARRFVETPAAAGAAPRSVDDAPVIEFQVRPSPDPSRTPEKPDRPRVITNNAAEAHRTVAEGPVQELPEQRRVDEAIEPAATREVKPSATRGAPTLTAETAEHSDFDQDSEGARREPFRGRPNLQDQAVHSTRVPANLAGEPEVPAGTSKQNAVKPVAVGSPMHGPQLTTHTHVATEIPAARPRDATPPAAAAQPPNAPEIGATLRQQSGRTTLHVVLQDERLGRLALQLVERGGWIEAAIRASDPRTAQTLSNGAAGLFDALQQRGLALATGGGAASAWDAQEGQRRENPQRDQEPQGRRFRLRRNAGEFEGALARAEI